MATVTCENCTVTLGEAQTADEEEALRSAHESACDPDFGQE